MNHIKTPRFPLGCDQQGRHPEAAHAASEHDDEPELTLSDRVLHWLTPSRFWTLYALVIGAAVLGVWFARGAV